MGSPSRGRIARYCAGLESPWDLSRASSNLALGATIIPELRRMVNLVGAGLIRCACPSSGMQEEVGGESGVPAPPHDMPRLSDYPRNPTLSKLSARLSPLDGLVTECAYHASLSRRYWSTTESVMLVIAILGYVLGAWDLGIGELSGGGDYNRSGIFGQDSGFLHMGDLTLILALLSIICWVGVISMLWMRYPIMRENMAYLLIGVIFVQAGYLKAHAESPDFPFGAEAAQWVWVITVNLVLLFLAVFVVHRAVVETRDIHVQERHSHPDPRVFQRAWKDHSLKAWSTALAFWMVLLNISSWSGSHAISPSPGDLDLSYPLVGTYALTGILSVIVFLNILWFPQFMLGGAEDRIQTFRAREVAGESVVKIGDEQGRCPVCNQETAAIRSAKSGVQVPCSIGDCIGVGQPGASCDKCETRIPTRVICANCGSSTPAGSHFGRVEAW